MTKKKKKYTTKYMSTKKQRSAEIERLLPYKGSVCKKKPRSCMKLSKIVS